jgi:TATA-binding protein-associated factor
MFVAEEFRDKDKNILTHLTKKTKEEVYSYDQSGKLLGLYDKLVECDIITAEEAKSSIANTEDISLGDMAATSLQNVKARPHRALIFCQFGSFLRMIVDQVLKPFKVSYIELLSQHSPKERVEIVDHFNSDETIKVLILTTAVGGLGLTLTGADTVIFAEHDWNPMRDL